MSRRRRRERREMVFGVGAIALAVVVLGSLFVYAIQTGFREVPLGKDLCPETELPSEVWVVLLDVTDSFSSIQREFIRQEFEGIQRRVMPRGQLALYVLGADGAVSFEPVAALCSPGPAENVSWWDDNPRIRRQEWEEGFARPLGRSFETAMTAQEGARSPILEQIQVVSVSALKPLEGRPRHLVIFSDMLQHTDSYSHYAQSPPRYEDFAATSVWQRVRTQLRGVEVQIFYVRREGQTAARVQRGTAHVDFWKNYFLNMDATLGLSDLDGRTGPAFVRVPG